jgi:5-methyltetrahydrofolate--homocysteine methyltransferase
LTKKRKLEKALEIFMDMLDQISESLQNGDDTGVQTLTRQALEQNIDPGDILDRGLIAGMAVVGEKFKVHDIFLPDVLLAAKAMYAGMDLLKPHFVEGAAPTKGKIVLGTVQGDLHDIGKNLVAIMLKGAGYEVIDLGNDVSPENFVDTAISQQAPVIGLSALLTTTMPIMKDVVDLVRSRGLSDRIKVIIGGAPINEDYAREIGADAYGFDGINAVERVQNLMER